MAVSSSTVDSLGSALESCCRLHGILRNLLVFSNHSREAVVSTSLTVNFGQIASGIPWFVR